MNRDPSEIRDALVSSVQTLGDRADIMNRIPDAWQDGASTVIDHLSDSVHDARSRVSTLAKESAQPLIASDRAAIAAAAKDRRMKAISVILVLSLFVMVRRRRKQRRRSDDSQF